VRRVRVQTIDASGNDVDPPSYGLVGSDNDLTLFNDMWETRDELEAAIAAADSILQVIDPNEKLDPFGEVDHAIVGRSNYFGDPRVASEDPDIPAELTPRQWCEAHGVKPGDFIASSGPLGDSTFYVEAITPDGVLVTHDGLTLPWHLLAPGVTYVLEKSS
jgi:hypothetical protein